MSANAIPNPMPDQTFDYWWDRPGEWVEPPNQRRGGESGVKRVQDESLGTLYLKRQVGHTYIDVWHPFGRPTALRERDALVALAAIGLTVPRLVYCEARRVDGEWQTVLVTKALDGYEDLKNWYGHGGRDRLTSQFHEELLCKIGGTLARLHKHHWQHTCLYAKHVFLTTVVSDDGLPDVALIDLEKCRRRWSAGYAARRDLDQFRRHSPMWNDADWANVLEGHREGFGKAVM